MKGKSSHEKSQIKIGKEFTFSKEESRTDNPFDKSLMKSEMDIRFESEAEVEDDPPERPFRKS